MRRCRRATPRLPCAWKKWATTNLARGEELGSTGWNEVPGGEKEAYRHYNYNNSLVKADRLVLRVTGLNPRVVDHLGLVELCDVVVDLRG